MESTPLSEGSVGDNAIGRRLAVDLENGRRFAVDLENGRDGEKGGLSPFAMPLRGEKRWFRREVFREGEQILSKSAEYLVYRFRSEDRSGSGDRCIPQKRMHDKR